jgi:hypothetical protein
MESSGLVKKKNDNVQINLTILSKFKHRQNFFFLGKISNSLIREKFLQSSKLANFSKLNLKIDFNPKIRTKSKIDFNQKLWTVDFNLKVKFNNSSSNSISIYAYYWV